MNCPQCNKEMYDNRQKKASGEYKTTYPDFTCKDKQCLDPITNKRSAVYLEQKKVAGKEAPPTARNENLKAEVRKEDDTKEKSIILSYAKDIIVAEITAGKQVDKPVDLILDFYRKLYKGYRFPLTTDEL